MSNAEPYAHWDENLGRLLAQQGYDCSLAVADSAYDLFIGTPEQASSSSGGAYTRQEGNADIKYAWHLAPCDTEASFICEVPAAAYACAPPPQPPPLPPSPPSPPVPPAPPTCAPAANRTFFCDAQSVSCYLYAVEAATFEAARINCLRRRGDLVR